MRFLKSGASRASRNRSAQSSSGPKAAEAPDVFAAITPIDLIDGQIGSILAIRAYSFQFLLSLSNNSLRNRELPGMGSEPLSLRN